MKLGIYLPNFGAYGDARVLANPAQDAENSGWDGAFPLFQVEENEQELAQLDNMVRYASKHRKHEQSLEIVIMGVTLDAESRAAANLVEQRAELGATWWLESITPFRSGKGYEDEWPVGAMRERILQGPPQLHEPH